MDLSFHGKVALVTGAGAGIGLASAQAFAEADAAVALADVDEETARTAAEGLVAEGHEAIGLRCDVTDARFLARGGEASCGRSRPRDRFALSDAEMAAVDALDAGLRNGPDPDVFDMAFLKARQAGRKWPPAFAAFRTKETEMKDEPTNAHKSFGDIAPHLAELTDKVLFGDVWEHPALPPRDRSLVTITSLISLYRVNELPFHLKKALENSVSRDEIVGTITHLAFYAGWPPAMTALQIARKVFEEVGQ